MYKENKKTIPTYNEELLSTMTSYVTTPEFKNRIVSDVTATIACAPGVKPEHISIIIYVLDTLKVKSNSTEEIDLVKSYLNHIEALRRANTLNDLECVGYWAFIELSRA